MIVGECRTFEEALEAFETQGVAALNDEEVVLLSQRGKIAPYALEKILGDFTRAVKIRRSLVCKSPFLPLLSSNYIKPPPTAPVLSV